jgi:lipid-A-disaccharide synthase
MEAAGMECDFVGHPVVAEPHPDPAEVAAFRARHGIGDAPLLLVLPGSRRGEVTRLAPVFGAALARVLAARPGMRLVLPTTAAMAPLVRDAVADWPARPLILSPDDPGHAAEKARAFHAADLALAASGTVSLELAHARTPMVIAYDMAPLSRAILSRLIRVDTLTLVNLVSETRTVPEFIGHACRPAPIASALLQVMEAPGAQEAAMEATMQRLGEGGEAPGLRAARAVLARM